MANDWTCSLTASPQRAPANETVTFTVTLQNSVFEEFRPEDQKQPVYEGVASTTKLSTRNDKLNNAIGGLAPVPTSQGINLTLNVPPDVPDGNHVINVTIGPGSWTTAAPFVGLPSLPAAITGSTTFSTFTPAIQVDTRTTLQRTFAGPTDDRALWVAIRNDLAAPGQPNHGRRASGPKSIRDLEALPSSTLRWLYNLMPEPTKFEIYGHERQLAKRILAERDVMDATNIDLKGFTEDFYRTLGPRNARICQA